MNLGGSVMRLRQNNDPDRVRRYSSDRQLREIEERTLRNIRLYASQPADVIDERIQELGREWSIERFLQLNAAAIGISTAALAVLRSRKWGFATCVGLGFFLVHATEGFDPPIPLLRKLGVRTRGEIDREIYALKIIRGDFDHVEQTVAPSPEPAAAEALRAVGVRDGQPVGH